MYVYVLHNYIIVAFSVLGVVFIMYNSKYNNSIKDLLVFAIAGIYNNIIPSLASSVL